MVGFLIVCYYRVYFNHAENHTFPHVGIGIPHLVGEDICEALKIIYQLLPLKWCQYGLIRLGLLHFLNKSKLVLNHSQQSL